MNTRFFLTNMEPTVDNKCSTSCTTSTSNVNASPRFIKSPTPVPVLDSDFNSDSESISSLNKPRSPCSILSQDDSHFVSSDEMNFGVTSIQENPNTASASEPTLIMPRVTLPSKRPFTQNGMNLGKLKILIAGDSGVGKTSLIQAITQINQDIVHVDEPIHQYPQGGVWEVPASTKPYPLFWLNDQVATGTTATANTTTEKTANSSNSRRTSLVHSSVSSDEGVLERNVCFVDSFGYGDHNVDKVVSYLDQKFRQTAQLVNANSSHVLGLLTANSSDLPHVDVCLYLVLDRLKQIDLDYMKDINKYCPIIPVVSKSDMLPDDQILDLKVDILKQMKRAGIIPFLFDTSVEDAIQCGEMLQEQPKQTAANGQTNEEDDKILHPLLFPCTVSSVENGTEMAASVLMSPEYVPELASSELTKLCSYVFSEQGSAWLRYTAAKRFIDWSVCYHVSNTLDNALVHVAQQRAAVRSCASSSSATTEPSVTARGDQEYIINLPSSIFANRDKAQQQTARWAMQLEQAARSENAYALRARYRGRRSSSVPYDYSQTRKKRPHMPRSILNLDPLGLKGLSEKALKYALRALSVLLGIKIVAIIYSRSLFTVAAEHQQHQQLRRPSSLIDTAIQALGWPLVRV